MFIINIYNPAHKLSEFKIKNAKKSHITVTKQFIKKHTLKHTFAHNYHSEFFLLFGTKKYVVVRE